MPVGNVFDANIHYSPFCFNFRLNFCMSTNHSHTETLFTQLFFFCSSPFFGLFHFVSHIYQYCMPWLSNSTAPFFFFFFFSAFSSIVKISDIRRPLRAKLGGMHKKKKGIALKSKMKLFWGFFRDGFY